MKSNLNKLEFKKRLMLLTSKENDFFSFSPYNSSGTPFCGVFDDNTFELTRNTFWRHVKAIVIKGEYIEAGDHSTEITYKLGWAKFMKLFFIIINCFAFAGFNFIVIAGSSNHFDVQLLSTLSTMNGFLIFANLWVMIVHWITKKIVNQRFGEEFEIGMEDEWEKLAKSTIEHTKI